MPRFSIAAAVLCLALGASGNPPEGVVDRAIVHILKTGYPQYKVHPRPAHPLLKDTEARGELVRAIERAADRHGVPAMLLVTFAFREGSFGADAVGALGEESMFQMMPRTADLVRVEEPDCDLGTVQGSAYCAAAWLRMSRDRCGGALEGALAQYVTGQGCIPKSDRVKWIVRDRMRLAKILESL